MSKHYLHAPEGTPLALLCRLPSFLIRLSDGARCDSPDAIEANGDLHLYGYTAFDSTPATLDAHDTEQSLTLADVKMVDGKPTATHPKTTLTRLQLRRKLFREGVEKLRATDWTQTDDYKTRFPLKAATWSAWRHGVRTVVKALKANTIDPLTVTYNDPPEPIEDTI